jgi:hypothetical protein
MSVDQSGLKWPALPVAGAVGAGRRDALPEAPAGFGLTPSGEAEQEQARQVAEIPAEVLEVPDAGSE